jgi:hypothetical protein
MKKLIFPIVASGMLLFSACSNDNSSTVATQDDDEQSGTSHSAGKEHQTGNEEGTHTSKPGGGSAPASPDTMHNNMGMGRDSAGRSKQSGNSASMDSNLHQRR